MSDQIDLAANLLRGAAAIAQEMFGVSDRSARRKVYHLQDQIPVFQLDDSGTLYAFRSRLRAHLEARSAEKEARIAAATVIKPAVGRPSPKARRRRRAATEAA
jgi:hypothetical protein